MKVVAYSKEAQRVLLRLPTPIGQRIRMKIEQYARDPSSLSAQVKKLQGFDGVMRLRVGDWRVIFTERGEIIAIIKIATRQSAYS